MRALPLAVVLDERFFPAPGHARGGGLIPGIMRVTCSTAELVISINDVTAKLDLLRELQTAGTCTLDEVRGQLGLPPATGTAKPGSGA
jgi:hypothetical protein